MDPPKTPIHVAPDVEVSLPNEPFQSNDLELNPDLDEEDEDTPSTSLQTQLTNHNNDKDENEDIDGDTDYDVALWTLPFDLAYELLLKQFSDHADQPVVTESQQSKFINYIDGEILQVQRRFIKNQAETSEIYPLAQLLQDVAKILDLIWYLINSKNKLYGQDEYFIKITGDLEDWMAYYLLGIEGPGQKAESDLFKFFNFFKSLDTRLCFLIDGYHVGLSLTKMSLTEVVRLVPIISRLRFEIVSKFDQLRAKLTHQKSLGNLEADALLNKLDVEIGRLFEGILERT